MHPETRKNEEKKLFSVVIPVYNGEKYIRDTLRSIFNQTYQKYEIIVVDGLSTDQTLSIVNEYSDRIAHIISEKDAGMYDAVNKGFRLASGDYFCYINSDDRLTPIALEKAVDKFSQNSFDLVFGDVNYINESGNLIYSLKSLNLPKVGVKYIRRLPFAQQSAFWTKDIFHRVGGFDANLKYVADSKFLFDIYLDPQTKTAHIPFVLGEFRMHSDSFSIGSSEKMIKESKLMRQRYPELGNSTLLKFFFEFFLKVINAKAIYKKKNYEGVRLQ
ncbi:glycosyltransferase family 2 protein [Dyadobacter sp. Leaf189]|uniref:glycosyltransferase family 2 protein n=1 Tax=Dyadobacter sp. Leaf189 TaxID=1736295 RepID=UPI0006FD4D6B|nr:glycosyltransferase family 2 protein [Dyadobacter sp. Leaf189]KQS30698.1 hypothetical protein ASG33_09915 [Dyadobacter sp. Leaf189]